MQTIIIRKITTTVMEDLVLTVPKSLHISDLQNMIRDNSGISPDTQKLYFGGKQLVPQHSLLDYKVNDKDVIQLMGASASTPVVNNTPSTSGSTSPDSFHVSSSVYKVGDAVDVIYKELGAWFEAKIVQINTKTPTKDQSDELDLIFEVVMDRDEKLAPITVHFNDIRPRAFYTYRKEELEPGMVVFVNYNVNKPKLRGYWYDFFITNMENDVVEGTLMRGNDNPIIDNCRIVFVNEIMRIEDADLLLERTNDENRSFVLRKIQLYCNKCKDNNSKKCKECSCCVCGRKEHADKMIICDECERTYHLFCLVPSLAEIPAEPEWYCPDCKTDENEIVKGGEMLKPSQSGTACRTENNYVQNHFGKIFRIEVGASWDSLEDMLPIHGSSNNVHGSEELGVYSIILNETNLRVDEGNEFYYDVFTDVECPGNVINVKSAPNIFSSIKLNRMLSLNCDNADLNSAFGKAANWSNGKPIRIFRSHQCASLFAPETGYRYDGIYKVVEYFPEYSCGLLWRYLLRRDDEDLPPWKSKRSLFVQDVNSRPFRIDSRTMQIINEDSANESSWNECIQAAGEGREEFIDKVREMFKCIFCQDVVHLPVATDCNHHFCYSCLSNYLALETKCPLCSTPLDKEQPFKVNNKLFNAFKIIFPEV